MAEYSLFPMLREPLRTKKTPGLIPISECTYVGGNRELTAS